MEDDDPLPKPPLWLVIVVLVIGCLGGGIAIGYFYRDEIYAFTHNAPFSVTLICDQGVVFDNSGVNCGTQSVYAPGPDPVLVVSKTGNSYKIKEAHNQGVFIKSK